MKLDNYDRFYRTSAAWALLRARSAPAILAFLEFTFKDSQKFVLPWFEVETALVDFLEFTQSELKEEAESTNLKAKASAMLDRWVKEGWLRKFPDDQGDDFLELTAETEKALLFAQSLERQEFVGTESRFKDIFQRLKEMVEGSKEDPVEKIKALQENIKKLEDEIKLIKRRGEVTVLTDTQLKERFYTLSKTARELLSDFKEVAQNFKDITRKIYQKQGEKKLIKGELLGFALDRIEELKESDQGKSFYAFWEFLISSQRQEELNKLIHELIALFEERAIAMQDPLLRSLKRQLYENGQLVLETNQLLAEKLNRVISTQNLKEQKRALELIQQIRHWAMEEGSSFENSKFWEVPVNIPVALPLARPLGEPEAESRAFIHPQEQSEQEFLPEDMSELFDQFYIDRPRLEAYLRRLLQSKLQVSLEEVLQAYPLTKGLAELLTYFAIASSSTHHFIQKESKIEVVIEGENARRIWVPQLIFTQE